MKIARSNLRLARELAVRDIQGVYSRSSLGFAWIVVTPLAVLAIYWFVFAKILGISWSVPGSDGRVGYALPFFCGFVPYMVIAEVVSSATRQFEAKRSLVSKAAFPLFVIPLATWIRSGIVAFPALMFLIVFALLQAKDITWSTPLAFGGLLCVVLLSAGLALLLSTLGAFFGDLQHALQLATRILFYTAPISFPITAVPKVAQGWLFLNPLTAITEWIRTPLLTGLAPPLHTTAIAASWSVGLFILGTLVFARVKRFIPDVV